MLGLTLRKLMALGAHDAEALRALGDAHVGRALITRADQLVYGELDPLSEVYLLTSGTVRLFVGEGAQRRTTGLLAAPSLFGDRDLLAGCAVAEESARSISKAQLLCFEPEAVPAAWQEADLRGAWVQDLLQRAARASRLASYLAEPLEVRVLWLLHEHQPTGEGELPAYESLALMTDSAEKSVGRAVRTLQETGQLILDGKRGFRIAAEARLELVESQHLGLLHRWGRAGLL